MSTQFTRTEMMFGKDGIERLRNAHVAVFGIGGVGGHVVEALVRSGVGRITLIDNDRVAESNLNRQIIATQQTIGMDKVDAMAERIMVINPKAVVVGYKVFYGPDTADLFDFAEYDYVVDAIDSVTGKIELAVRAAAAGVPLISSMGAGNKVDPTAFEVTDIYRTSVCPLARVMRRELKKRGIEKLKVVYSKEEALTPLNQTEEGRKRLSPETLAEAEAADGRRQVPASNAFVPAVAGLIIAGEVIKDLTGFSR
ncbi:MAG: tRNA threonylcarbamoyladenosine dehydratase [Lachnospiraceae bacterium]|nr:tRNA threonylcarbamoyladenosine dehydratase [Lachnospiraceae bacterium]